MTILEREARVLARVASPGFSDFLTGRHRAQGIDIRTAVDVVEFVEKSGSVVGGVDLAGGERIECDSVLVGVGAVANDDIAREAGIACQGGILVDDRGRTNRPGIYAIGDVTCRPLGGDGSFGSRAFRVLWSRRRTLPRTSSDRPRRARRSRGSGRISSI